jgi:hypothetical protein
MASFRDIQFETEIKYKKLEKSKTINNNTSNTNPFQTYKLYNSERNISKNKINSSLQIKLRYSYLNKYDVL